MTGREPLPPIPLPRHHPHLLAAQARLRRTHWAWAILSFALGALSIGVSIRTGGEAQLVIAGIPWLLTALLLALSAQPALLALVAAQLAFSAALLIPSAAAAFGPDPVALTFGAPGVEAALSAFIRAILAVTAWSQFLFYRMLYGTATASGLDPSLPAVPEVVPNRSDAFAAGARALGGAALVTVLAALALMRSDFGLPALGVGHGMAVYALGLGVGAAFSPTTRRAAALTGIALGSLAFLAAAAAGRFLLL